MQKINLKKVIEAHHLDEKEVARQLFPGNKFPELALQRVMRGKALLNSDQLSRLSALANLSVGELYGLNWKAAKKENVLTLTAGNFRAELDTNTWITKLFDDGSLFHESVIHSGTMPLSQYLHELGEIIENHKNQK